MSVSRKAHTHGVNDKEVADKPHDDLNSSDDDAYVPPNPQRLKEAGNIAWKAKDVEAAIDLWKQALKEALKASVRSPSAELFTLQLDTRMNLARGFMEQEDYVMAKEHMSVVIEHRGDNKKALFRMAQVCFHLNDEGEVESLCDRILVLEPADPAVLDLKQKARRAKQEAALAQKRLLQTMAKNKNAFSDERSHLTDAYDNGEVGNFDPSVYDALMKTPPPVELSEADQAERRRLMEDVLSKLFKYRGDDSDEFESSNLWNGQWSSTEIKRDKTALVLTGPLTLLHAIENIIRVGLMGTSEKPVGRDTLWNRVEPTKETSTSAGSELGGKPCRPEMEKGNATQLPDLRAFENNFVPVDNLRIGWELAKELMECCSRHACSTNKGILGSEPRRVKRPFTVYVIGARGDIEMQSKWTAMLERLPCVDFLQIILIGFQDADDPWSAKLQPDHLTPPLTKSPPAKLAQKLVCRLYKGKFSQFIRSKAVVDCVDGKVAEKEMDIPICPEQGGQPAIRHYLPSVLWMPEHPLYPDLIFVPEPNLSRHFDDFVPDLAQLVLAKKPIILAGYSALERTTHEARQLIPVMKAMGARLVLPMHWNPYSVVFAENPDLPPMPLFAPPKGGANDDAQVELFSGITAKYGVVVGFWGAGNSSREWLKLHKLITERQAVQAFREEIESMDIDVSAEAEARKQMYAEMDQFTATLGRGD